MRAISPAVDLAKLGHNVPSDADCVRAVLAGHSDAFRTLVERYQHEHMRFALRMLGTREDADEALQGAFVRAYRSLAQCRDGARFGAWLYRIVVNECRTRATRRARRERWFVRDSAALERASAEDATERAMLREEIQRALGRLAPEQREAFVLKYVEELEYDEMSKITGASVSALKMRAARACRKLRSLLGDLFDA